MKALAWVSTSGVTCSRLGASFDILAVARGAVAGARRAALGPEPVRLKRRARVLGPRADQVAPR